MKDMGTTQRMIVTIVIWFTLFLMFIGTLFSDILDSNPVYVIPILIILGIAGAASTSSIWEERSASPDKDKTEKFKRDASYRIDRLIDALDEDDLAELRRRLSSAEESERPVSLEELLDDFEEGRTGR